MYFRIALFLISTSLLSAQYMPIPQQRQQRPRPSAPSKRSDTPGELLFKFDGVVKESSKKEFTVEVEGEQNLTFHRGKDIKIMDGKDQIKDKSLPVGTKLSVEAKREMNGDLTAMIVHLNPEPKQQ